MISGAAAEIALEYARQVRALLLAQAGSGHDHSGRAKAALKPLRGNKGLLHRMQLAIGRQSFDRGHLAIGSPEGGNQAAMHRDAFQPHRARPAITRVTAFLDPEPSAVTQKRAQTLARPWFTGKDLAIDTV